MAPHGYCFAWLPEIVWLHASSDLLIALSYFSIPVALWLFAKKRPDLPFRKIFTLFATFITLCGLTHIMGIVVLWVPLYGVQGLLMLLTGAVSAATAILVWRALPDALRLPSPSMLQEMNRKLNESYEETERKVRERTNELEIANYELSVAKRKADEASHAKTNFLANMSHEIRTPMNAVVGISNILSISSPLTGKQQEYIQTLKNSADHLLEIINDLLDFAKVEDGSVQLENVDFSFPALLEKIIGMMSVKAQEKGINLFLDYEPELGKHFRGDPFRIQQVLNNLLSNAIKFTEQGNVTVKVSGKMKSDDVMNVVIQVIDTGIGIPYNKLGTIFEKFTQADTSTTRKYGGSGLGLSICNALVNLMKGDIKVTSEINKGSVFTVNLPLEISVQKSINENKVIEVEHKQIKNAPCVLLVEDYKPNILVATTLIEGLGYQCEVANDGYQAVEKFKSFKYPLIFMDIQMPGIDGFETTRRIRSIEGESGEESIIIAMTAHAMDGDREKCLKGGMDDYIPKPFNPEDLQHKLKYYLKENKAA